jgi:hypothetical protein
MNCDECTRLVRLYDHSIQLYASAVNAVIRATWTEGPNPDVIGDAQAAKDNMENARHELEEHRKACLTVPKQTKAGA